MGVARFLRHHEGGTVFRILGPLRTPVPVALVNSELVLVSLVVPNLPLLPDLFFVFGESVPPVFEDAINMALHTREETVVSNMKEKERSWHQMRAK